MTAPQIIILVLVLIDLMISAYKHGKPCENNHNVWTAIIGKALLIALLAWGGFFNGIFN